MESAIPSVLFSGSTKYIYEGYIDTTLHSEIFLYRCVNNNQVYCIKSSTIKDCTYQDQEVEIMRMLDEKRYVVTLYDAFEFEGKKYVAIDYCENGDLYNYLFRDQNPFDLEDALVLMSRLIDALRYIHNNRILHGDIKPENIFLKKSSDKYLHPVIGDFDYATYLNANQECHCHRGTALYLPESFGDKPHSFPIDVYGLGKCFYYVTEEFSENRTLPGFVKNIINEMIIEEDDQRISIDLVRKLFDIGICKFFPHLITATSLFNSDDENAYDIS